MTHFLSAVVKTTLNPKNAVAKHTTAKTANTLIKPYGIMSWTIYATIYVIKKTNIHLKKSFTNEVLKKISTEIKIYRPGIRQHPQYNS